MTAVPGRLATPARTKTNRYLMVIVIVATEEANDGSVSR